MIKFNKVFYSKIISLILACIFLFTNITYGIDIPERPHLRKPLDFNGFNITPRYLCALLAATYHNGLKQNPEQAFAGVMEEMSKRNAEELGIKVTAFEGGIRISHEKDNIDITANDDGTFGAGQSELVKLALDRVNASAVAWPEIVAMVNQGNQGSRYILETLRQRYGHLKFMRVELSVKDILEKEGAKLIIRLNLDDPTVKAIAESEKPTLPVLVVKKDGKYIVLDGSHRIAAAARKTGAYKIDALGRPKIDLALLGDKVKIKAYFAVYEERGIDEKTNQGLGMQETLQSASTHGPVELDSYRLQELKKRIFDEIDRSIYGDAVSLNGRIEAYEYFVLSQAKRLGIRVENNTPGIFEYNKEMIKSLAESLRYLFSELMKGNLKRATRTLATVIAFTACILFQTIPPMSLDKYNANGEQDRVMWSGKGKILYLTNITVLVGIGVALGVDWGFTFLMPNLLEWIVISRMRVEGHELSHVYQTLVLERIRQELVGNKMSPEVFAKLMPAASRQRPIDTYPKPILREPPNKERLKAIVEGIFEELTKYARLATQGQGLDLDTSATEPLQRQASPASALIGKYELLTNPVFDEDSGTIRFMGISIETGRVEEITLNANRAPPETIEKIKQILSALIKTDNNTINKVLNWFNSSFSGQILLLEDNSQNIFGLGASNLVAINKYFSNNPIALFHEIAEAAINAGIITTEEIISSLQDRTWYDAHIAKAGRENLKPHYALIALQEEVFKWANRNLTTKIKVHQQSIEELFENLSSGAVKWFDTASRVNILFKQLLPQERANLLVKILRDDYNLRNLQSYNMATLLTKQERSAWEDVVGDLVLDNPEELPYITPLLIDPNMSEIDKSYIWRAVENIAIKHPLEAIKALHTVGFESEKIIVMVMAHDKLNKNAEKIISYLLTSTQPEASEIAQSYAKLILAFLRQGQPFNASLIEDALNLLEPSVPSDKKSLPWQSLTKTKAEYINQLFIINDIFQEALKLVSENPDITYEELYRRLINEGPGQEKFNHLTKKQRVLVKSAFIRSRADRLRRRNEFEEARKNYPIDELNNASSEITELYKKRKGYLRSSKNAGDVIALHQVIQRIGVLRLRLVSLRRDVAPFLEKRFGILAKDAPEIAIIRLGNFGLELYVDSESLQRAFNSREKEAVEKGDKYFFDKEFRFSKHVDITMLRNVLRKFPQYVFGNFQNEMVAYLTGAELRSEDFDELLDIYMDKYLDSLLEYIKRQDWFNEFVKANSILEGTLEALIAEVRTGPEWQKTKQTLKEVKKLLDDLVDVKATLLYYKMKAENPEANTEELTARAYREASSYILGIFQLIPILKADDRLKDILAQLKKGLEKEGISSEDVLSLPMKKRKPRKDGAPTLWAGFQRDDVIVSDIEGGIRVVDHEGQHLIFRLYTGTEAMSHTRDTSSFYMFMNNVLPAVEYNISSLHENENMGRHVQMGKLAQLKGIEKDIARNIFWPILSDEERKNSEKKLAIIKELLPSIIEYAIPEYKDNIEAVYLIGGFLFKKSPTDLDLVVIVRDNVDHLSIARDLPKDISQKLSSNVTNFLCDIKMFGKDAMASDQPEKLRYLSGVYKSGILLSGSDLLIEPQNNTLVALAKELSYPGLMQLKGSYFALAILIAQQAGGILKDVPIERIREYLKQGALYYHIKTIEEYEEIFRITSEIARLDIDSPDLAHGLSETIEQESAENEKIAKIILNAIGRDIENIRDPNKLCGWVVNFTFNDTSVDPYKVLEFILEEFDQVQYLDIYKEVLGIKISKAQKMRKPPLLELIEQDWSVIDTTNLEELMDSLKPSREAQKIELEEVEMSPLGHGILSSHSPEELADLKDGMAMVNKWVEEKRTMGGERIFVPFTIHGIEISFDGKPITMNVNGHSFIIKAFKDKMIVEAQDDTYNVYPLFERIDMRSGFSGIAVLGGREFMFYREGNKIILRPLHEILRIHRTIAANLTVNGALGIRKAERGLYRADSGFRDLLTYPDPEDISRLMNKYFKWLEKEEYKIQENSPEALHPVELAAQAFCKLLWIHPFENGNTRTAGLVMNYILMKNGFPPFMLNAANERRFYELERFMDAPVREEFYKTEQKSYGIIDGDKIFSFTSDEYSVFLASQLALQLVPGTVVEDKAVSGTTTVTSVTEPASQALSPGNFKDRMHAGVTKYRTIISNGSAPKNDEEIKFRAMAHRDIECGIDKVLPVVNPNGKGLTVYYPAAGFDIAIVLASTDATTLIYSDLTRDFMGQGRIDNFTAIIEEIESMGGKIISQDIPPMGQEGRCEIKFELPSKDGRSKTRTLIYYSGVDAEEFIPLEIYNGYDVLWAATPDMFMSLPGIHEELFRLLKEGGFAVFGNGGVSELEGYTAERMFNHVSGLQFYKRWRFVDVNKPMEGFMLGSKNGDGSDLSSGHDTAVDGQAIGGELSSDFIAFPKTDNEVVWGWRFPQIVKTLIKFNLIPASGERERIENFLSWADGVYKEGLAIDQEEVNNTDRRLLISISIYRGWVDLLKETGQGYPAKIDELWNLIVELKKYEEAIGIGESFFDEIGVHNKEELREHLSGRIGLKNIEAIEETSKGADYQHLKRYWLEINGGRPLRGMVEIGGSKHSVITLMGGLLLANGEINFSNFPMGSDGLNMLKIYESFGVQAKLDEQGHFLALDIPQDMEFSANEIHRAQLLRGSILFLGSSLLRFGRIEFPVPGGDKIGRDFHKHFEILDDFGVSHGKPTDDLLKAWLTVPLEGDRVIDGKIQSGSGAGYSGTYTTALAMILAAGNRGKTTINNAVVTSDITELGRYLLEIGVNVQGLGTETLIIESPGIDHLNESKISHKIDPDKNEIVFWIVAAIMSSGVIDMYMDFDGEVTLDHLGPLGSFYRDILEPMGIVLEKTGEKTFRIDSEKCRLKPVDLELIYKGENSNVVDPMMNLLPLLTIISQGKSIFIDLKHGSERLRGRVSMEKMGAELIPVERGVEIFGAEKIYPSEDLYGSDIRDASNLLLMSLRAEGRSTLYGLEYIERAYDNILSKLTRLGADVRIKRSPVLLTQAITDSELEDEIRSFLRSQRFGPSIDNDKDQIYVKTLVNTFKEEIRASLKEAKTLDDVVSGNDALRQALDMNEYSRMFRYLDFYRELETKALDSVIHEYINKYKETSEKQTLQIGIIGTSYGQELISLAVFIEQEVRKALVSQGLPLDAIQIKINAFNKADPIFEKLKRNQVFYPKDMLNTYQEAIAQDQAERLFEVADKGIRRSGSFNQNIAFYDLNLLDKESFPEGILPMDVVFIHNVLHHVSNAAFKIFSEEEALGKVQSAQEYIASLIGPHGAISIIAQGDYFFGGKDKTSPAGFVLLNPFGNERECIFSRVSHEDGSITDIAPNAVPDGHEQLLDLIPSLSERDALSSSI